jgi:DNA polymerase-3 subunit beta
MVDEKKFSLEIKKIKNIVLFNPEIGPEDGISSDGAVTINISKGKLKYSILSFRYLLVGEEPVEINDEIEMVLPLKKIQDILRSFPEDSIINFKVIKENIVNIDIDGIKFGLKEIHRDGINQIIEEDETETTYKVPRTLFLDGLKKVKIAMGDDEVRYYLNGIYMEVSQNKSGDNDMFFVATSGHLLATYGIKKDSYSLKEKVIIPKKVIPDIMKVLEKGDEEILVSFTKKRIDIKSGNLKIIVKIIEAEFPDYNRVIPKENNKSIALDINNLKNILTKISIVSASDKSKDVRISSVNGLVTLEVNSEGNNATSDMILSGNKDIDDLETKLNIKYILDMLEQFNEESLVIKFIDGNSPLLIEQSKSKDLIFVIMPIRS